jgi:hypothetical protein
MQGRIHISFVGVNQSSQTGVSIDQTVTALSPTGYPLNKSMVYLWNDALVQ